jgi:2-polyprenyl-3-methyl-5-hydroxy-6-metoxy-1,4-benzoquinol methylase
MSQSDYTAYFRELADYYNNSRIPSNVMTGAAEIRAESEREGSWVRQCVESLHLTLAKKKVIEIGCGGGRWTQFIAQVAAQVVATDPCPRLLECARLMNLPNTEFVEADFLSLEKIEMTFNGACHVNIINHVPLQLLPTFLDKIHEKLEPGSMVFCASQRFRGNRDEPWYERRDTGDMVSMRHHDDGRPIEVVDTLFTEDLLRGLFIERARRLEMTLKHWWWWASYQVP